MLLLLLYEECSTQLLAEELELPPDAVPVLGIAELEFASPAVDVEATGGMPLLLELVATSAGMVVGTVVVDEEELDVVPLLSPLTARDVSLLLFVHFEADSKLLVLVRQVL